MSDEGNHNAADELFSLLHRVTEREAGPAEIQRLTELLRDPGLHAEYLEMVDLLVGLEWEIGANGDEGTSLQGRPMPSRVRSRRSFVALGFGIVVALSVWFAFSWTVPRIEQQPPASLTEIGTLDELSGRLVKVSRSGTDTELSLGTSIRISDTLRLDPHAGVIPRAVIRHRDGTRTTLIGPSQLRTPEKIAETVWSLDRGVLTREGRRGTRQSEAWSIRTPSAKVTLTNAVATIDAHQSLTHLLVASGEAALTRIEDESRLIVRAGEICDTQSLTATTPNNIAPRSDVWSEDFETGVPDEWTLGRPVTNDLPAGSKVALRAAPIDVGGGIVYQIGGWFSWLTGFVTLTETTHIRCRFSIETKSWFNVHFFTRNRRQPEADLRQHFCTDLPWWKCVPGGWYEVQIPLAVFRPLKGGVPRGGNEFPIAFWFSSDADIGLRIDEVSITPDGPGRIVLQEVEGSP